MKTLVTFASLAGLAIALAAPASAYDRVDARQDRQAQRIQQGIRSGALSPYEAARLRAEQARIARMESYARRDGHLSHYERARIAAAQDRASRSIYAEKHDGDRRHAPRRWHRW